MKAVQQNKFSFFISFINPRQNRRELIFGSFLILKILNYNFSVAVWVGIIALLGISVEIIVVKIKFLDLGFEKFNDKYNAIHWAVVRRIRPITITKLTAFFSLIPIMFEFSVGADILKRIVAPMIGGIFFTFILSFIYYSKFLYFV